MLKQIITTGVVAVGLLLSMQASAHQSHKHSHRDHQRYQQPAKPVFSVNKAQAIQASLINKGVKNHSLTRYEETKLRQEQKTIAHLEKQYRHGGLQSWERNSLEKRLKNSYARIKSYMNNHEKRHARKYKKSHHSKKSSHQSTRNGSFTVWISK